MLEKHTKTPRYTKAYTREDFSLTFLLKPLPSSEKVVEFLVSSLETKSSTHSSKTLLITPPTNTYLPPAKSSSSLIILSYSLLILLTNDSLYSLLTIYLRACLDTIMILLC